MECNQGINSVWGLTDRPFQVQKELQIDGSCDKLRLAYEARWLSSLSSKKTSTFLEAIMNQRWCLSIFGVILDCLVWPFCACENLVVTCGVVESVVWVFWNFATCLTSREKLCPTCFVNPQVNQIDFNTKDDLLHPPFGFENDDKTGIWDYLSVCFVRYPYCSASHCSAQTTSNYGSSGVEGILFKRLFIIITLYF